MNKIRDMIGRSPIHPFLLVIGKLAFAFCGLFFLIKKMSPASILYDSRVTSLIGMILLIAGFCLAAVALLHLGESVAVGIPNRKTVLKTHGLYRFSRNPIYLSGFLMCAGSCLYALHWINFLFFFLAAVIHHAIIKKEEEFLERTFGAEWLEYKKQVPRYLWHL